jgi:dihydroxy-acid dehydratase
VAPESHVGGPLALVQDGDLIELDVDARKLQLLVDDERLEERRRAWKPPEIRWTRGYLKMFSQHITQANEGCDFDFLHGHSAGLEPEI